MSPHIVEDASVARLPQIMKSLSKKSQQQGGQIPLWSFQSLVSEKGEHIRSNN